MADDEDAPAGETGLGRPVTVLAANVLIPPGLRDLLLSCADVGVFRPVWETEIENEVVRNTARLTVERRGIDPEEALAGAQATLAQMRRAFPDACADTKLWTPLVGQMTCDDKDRHVLAVAVGTGASHLVTINTRDFPVHSRPATIAVVKPDRFLGDRLAAEPRSVVAAVEGMSARLKSPPQSPLEIARLLADGQFTPNFGAELLDILHHSAASGPASSPAADSTSGPER